jgi:hypothetical protein
MPEVYMAWAVTWTESERGWGRRPELFSGGETNWDTGLSQASSTTTSSGTRTRPQGRLLATRDA